MSKGIGRLERILWLLGILVLLLAASSALLGLCRPLWIDELITYRLARDMSFLDMLVNRGMDKHPPLYFAIIRGWLALVESDSLARARIPSILFYFLSIYVIYQYVYKVYGNGLVSIAFAAVFASSASLTFYAAEARAYSMLCFFTCLAIYSRLNLFASSRQQPVQITLYGVSIFGIAFSHFFGALFVLIVTTLDVIKSLFARIYLRNSRLRSRYQSLYIAGSLSLLPTTVWLFVFLRYMLDHLEHWSMPLHSGLLDIVNIGHHGFLASILFITVAAMLLVADSVTSSLDLKGCGKRLVRSMDISLFDASMAVVLFVGISSVLGKPLILSRYILYIIPSFVCFVASIGGAGCSNYKELLSASPLAASRGRLLIFASAFLFLLLGMIPVTTGSPQDAPAKYYQLSSEYLKSEYYKLSFGWECQGLQAMDSLLRTDSSRESGWLCMDTQQDMGALRQKIRSSARAVLVARPEADRAHLIESDKKTMESFGLRCIDRPLFNQENSDDRVYATLCILQRG